MKVDLIRKYKWYIFGVVAVILIMSIGLSFCTWDGSSISSLIKNNVAHFGVNYGIAVDVNEDGVADVGDIVNFGKYYQSADVSVQNPTKDPIRWIVVHKENNQLTLLAEKVLTFGSFWNRYYANTSGNWVWEDPSFVDFHQDYMVSTLSMWLNSNYTSRNDRGTAFQANADKLGMRGFMREAFTSDEIEYINDRNIFGIEGFAQNDPENREIYGSKSFKVWVPSLSEIFGTTETQWGNTTDGSPNHQFDYFKNNNVAYATANQVLVAKATEFAANPNLSNYTTTETLTNKLNSQNKSGGDAAWWWLRSPHPSFNDGVLIVHADGKGNGVNSAHSHGGVRPAICINA